MPDFTIVAGPNGAGKSSFSYLYADESVRIHDADKHKIILKNRYPDLDISDEALDDYLQEQYELYEDTERSLFNSMLVESNLRTDYLIGRAKFLRTMGYSLNIIFVALKDTYVSIERVDARVRDHGHAVSAQAIHDNFKHGLRNFKDHVKLFDNVMIITPNLKQVENDFHLPTPLLIARGGMVTLREMFDEEWANELVAEVIDLLRS